MILRDMDRKFYKEDDGRKRPDIGSERYLQTVARRFLRHHLAAVSLIVLAVIVGAAILAPVIAPYDPNDIAGPFAEGPSKAFWLGTDQIGIRIWQQRWLDTPTTTSLLRQDSPCWHRLIRLIRVYYHYLANYLVSKELKELALPALLFMTDSTLRLLSAVLSAFGQPFLCVC